MCILRCNRCLRSLLNHPPDFPDQFLRQVSEQFESFIHRVPDALKDLYDTFFDHVQRGFPVFGVIRREIVLEGGGIVLTSMRRSVSGKYILRLFNNNPEKNSCNLKIGNVEKSIELKKYSFMTLVYDGKKLVESKHSDIY